MGERPVEIDSRVAHPARVYNAWLGGRDHYPVDQEAAELAAEANPGIVPAVRANRAFLGRTVRHLAREAGIRQFLDIGTGIPAAGNTHEVAQSVAGDARVVYVDNDRIVLAHARARLFGTNGAAPRTSRPTRETWRPSSPRRGTPWTSRNRSR